MAGNVPARTRGHLSAQAQESVLSRHFVLPAQVLIHRAELSSAVLLISTFAALAWANSPWKESYHHFVDLPLTIDLGILNLSMSVHHWINDALMTVFFFVVGMEIKRELLLGELSSFKKASLPVAAAVGGMVVPALLYAWINSGGPSDATRGWGVPMATDIAFALGVLSLLSERVPLSLRIFLLALAIVDDLGAIVVIAVFYTAKVHLVPLVVAGLLLLVAMIMRWLNTIPFAPYALVGVGVWIALHESGVHATLAGVALAAVIAPQPVFGHDSFANAAVSLLRKFRNAHKRGDHETTEAVLGQFAELTMGTEAPLDRLVRIIHPWSSFFIMPIFAFTNAGVEFSSEALSTALSSRVTWGIILGLVLGKMIGITGASWLVVRLRLASLPSHATWRQMVGISLLGGIGFTVAIFIAELAFDDPRQIIAAKIGIFAASLGAAVLGLGLLRMTPPNPTEPASETPR